MNTLDKQTAKLIGRIAENLPEMDGDIMQVWIQNPKRLQKFLRGLCLPEVITPKGENPVDTIIRVDCSIRPSYPDWMKEVIHLELETVGPADYDILAVEQWLHDGQKSGKSIEGNKIYDHLKKTDTLKTCLGLRDLEEIQKKGIVFFRNHFKGKVVFGWASIVRYCIGSLFVPYLYGNGGRVVLRWRCLGYDWVSANPGLRHASDLAKSPTG